MNLLPFRFRAYALFPLALLCSAPLSAQTCAGDLIINSCQGTLNDGSGVANYGNNLDCSWTINNPHGIPIRISFSEFQTQECCDFLTIYDGPDENAPVLGEFSGNTLPGDVNSSTGVVHLTFRTDESTGSTGWQMNYNGTAVMSACSGSMEDGSGPAPYANNQHCAWKIAPPGATSVTLSFEEFSIESKYDYVYVYDGPDGFSPMIGAYSGNFLPEPVTSGPVMLVVFLADISGSGPGWLANYTADVPDLVVCPGSLDQVEEGYTYQFNEDCTWLLAPAGAETVLLNFTEFDLAAGDYLYVHDGMDANAPLIAQLTGNAVPGEIQSGGPEMFLRFSSDAEDEAGGFAFTFDCAEATAIGNYAGNELVAFPNPAEDVVRIRHLFSKPGWLRVFDNSGKEVRTLRIGDEASGLRSISLAGLSPGIYQMRLEDGSQILHTRIVKK